MYEPFIVELVVKCRTEDGCDKRTLAQLNPVRAALTLRYIGEDISRFFSIVGDMPEGSSAKLRPLYHQLIATKLAHIQKELPTLRDLFIAITNFQDNVRGSIHEHGLENFVVFYGNEELLKKCLNSGMPCEENGIPLGSFDHTLI